MRRVFTSFDCIPVISLRTNLLPIHISLVYSFVIVSYVHCKYPVKNVREINLSIQFPDMLLVFCLGSLFRSQPWQLQQSLARLGCVSRSRVTLPPRGLIIRWQIATHRKSQKAFFSPGLRHSSPSRKRYACKHFVLA